MNSGKRTVGLLTIEVIIGAVVIGGGLFFSLAFLLNSSRPTRVPVGVVTAALTVVPLPTASPTLPPSPQVTLVETNTAPTAGSSELQLGSFVQVSGTGGLGLRLRSNPGLDFEPVYVGMEDEIFRIEDGPQSANDYIWWYLVAPFDPERNGWAVSNYLQPVQEP